MMIFEMIMEQVQSIIDILKEFDIYMGISLWQLFLLFLVIDDLIVIIKRIFGGTIKNDKKKVIRGLIFHD